MITSTRKQNDKEVETSFVHLMQMYMFVIEVLQKSKYLFLPGTPQGGRKHLEFFSSHVQLSCGQARKM